MTTDEALEILIDHNKWRRGEGEYEYGDSTVLSKYSPYEIGLAIDKIIEVLSSQRTSHTP